MKYVVCFKEHTKWKGITIECDEYFLDCGFFNFVKNGDKILTLACEEISRIAVLETDK